MPRESESCSDAGGAHRRHRAIPAAARATAGGRTKLEPRERRGMDGSDDGKRRRPRAAGVASTCRAGTTVRACAFARRRRATAGERMAFVGRAFAPRPSRMRPAPVACTSAGSAHAITEHFGWQVLARQRCEHAVLDTRRQFLGPLGNGGRRNTADGFGRGADRPAQQLKSARFLHAPKVSTLTNNVKGYLRTLKL